MSTTETTLSLAFARMTTIARRQGFKAVVSVLKRAVRSRLALDRLNDLDDHQLYDIGLTRHDLTRAATSTFFEDPLADLARSARSRARRMEDLR